MKGYKKVQKGIGLIEVLIAAVIFALGSLAIVQLQGNFFKSSSSANARSVAMSIAQEKLEDLRGVAATEGGFVSIVSNDGGRDCVDNVDMPDNVGNTDCTAGELSRPTGSVAKNNATYTRTWTVANMYYDTASTLLTAASCTTSAICGLDNTSLPVLPDQKNISVTISWSDTDGSAQTFTLDGLINANSTSSGGTILADTGGSGEQPEVPHIELSAPDVIPTQIQPPPPLDYPGDSDDWEQVVADGEVADEYAKLGYCNVETFSATEAPDPDLNTNPTLDNVIVRFASSVYQTYNPCTFQEYTGDNIDTSETEKIKYREDEFLTINCSCTLDTSGGTGNDQAGSSVTKTHIGTKTGQTNQQSDFCDLCCKDHHENSDTDSDFYCNSATNKEKCYDPYRESGEYNAGGDHLHYLISDPAIEADTTGDEYAEVCRIKRVDGFYQVVQDWKMIAHNVMVESDLSSEATSYQTYIGTSVNSYLDTLGAYRSTSNVGDWAATSPTVPTNGEQMMSRSIYVDYLTDTEIAALTTTGSSVSIDARFYEYKATQISDWKTGNTYAAEQNGPTPVYDTQATSPCDPLNTGLDACTDSPTITSIVNANTAQDKGVFRYDNSVSGNIYIHSNMADSNSGVVAEPAIEPADNNLFNDYYLVNFTGGPPAVNRMVQMATIPALTCPATWVIGNGANAVTASLANTDTTNWSFIALACSPVSGDAAASCENYASDQSNVTVTPSKNTATLACVYDDDDSTTKSCSSINSLSGGNRIDINGTFSCSIVLSESGNSTSCDLVCE